MRKQESIYSLKIEKIRHLGGLGLVKFSEVSDCAYVFCEDTFVCKEDILDEIKEYRGGEFFIVVEKGVSFEQNDTRNMLEDLAEYLYYSQELYEDWYEEFMKQTTNEDLEQITEVIKRIIKRVPTCYEPGEEIEFDM